MKIKVSVIVPVWNVEKYITKCLDSLVAQTLKEIEIIIVNDGSPDNSQKIIDKYVKKYPDKIKSFIKDNGGLGSARNLGLEQAKGKYVSFIDSDDYVDKNFAKHMYELAEKDNADVAVCDMIDIYEDKEIYHDFTNFKYLYQTTPSVCNKIFRRELFDKVRFKGKMWYEDLNIMLKIMNNIKKISVIHEGYYCYNCGDNSIMRNNNSKKNLDIIWAIEDAKEYLIENNEFDKDIYSCIIFNHVLIDTINRLESQKNRDKREVLNKLVNYCHDNISDYRNQEFYKSISRNRKIIAWLNYHRMFNISRILLEMKKKLKGDLNG